MSRDYDYSNENNMNRSRDLVLAPNEYCFLQSKTNGSIKTHVGPITTTISATESLVTFNTDNKKFEEVQDFEVAKEIFVSAPEGWYIVLKNPTKDGGHPENGKASASPEMIIGKKINITGPISFALYPGQMAKVVQGHRLRSNQYLLARVYDADAATRGVKSATIIDAEGNNVEKERETYFAGQLLVIKGTEVSFYMPPTGIEVIAIGGKGNDYVRDAVTLERLEYAILKDEDGEKRYIHGPAVVFPKPTETFVSSSKGENIFRALELSPISGIYVKVIAEYCEKDKDGNEVQHPVGEELFITGKEQMIYHPRPEHAIIQYDGKYMHHAIAIPEGEGRYIMNRLTGEIKTIVGPQMYLPDPRTEVVVKRKLTKKECGLLYPNNKEVLEYNEALTEKSVEKSVAKGISDFSFSNSCTTKMEDSLALFESKANIGRGTSYTKPRTITLDNKYDGVVSVDVWTGWAINVTSKKGTREVVVGPTTRLLDYDETLEAMELSTGKPKTTDELLTTAYLRIDNNKISDIIRVQTKDFVEVNIKVSYCVDFLKEYKDRWFSVENYVKYLCDKIRSLLKREVKKYSIQEFYNNSTDIVRKLVLKQVDQPEQSNNEFTGRFFQENGMLIKDVEVLSVNVSEKIGKILLEHQVEMVTKAVELSDAEENLRLITEKSEVKKKEADVENNTKKYILELENIYNKDKLTRQEELNAMHRAMEEATKNSEIKMQQLRKEIEKTVLEREKARKEFEIDFKTKMVEIQTKEKEAYAATIKSIFDSISPDLVAALTSSANSNLMEACAKSMSPYAIAGGKSIDEVVNTLMRGTSLEGILNQHMMQRVAETSEE